MRILNSCMFMRGENKKIKCKLECKPICDMAI